MFPGKNIKLAIHQLMDCECVLLSFQELAHSLVKQKVSSKEGMNIIRNKSI
jgi:hypothetical protein